LLPRIYCEFRSEYECPLDPRYLARFQKLMQLYGGLCQSLTTNIDTTRIRTYSVHRWFMHFPNLKKIVLDLQSRLARHPTSMELQSLKDIYDSLPPVSDLCFFGWPAELVASFEGCSLPTVYHLALCFSGSSEPLSVELARAINTVFPSLISITIGTHFPNTPSWVQSAFEHRQIERLTLCDGEFGFMQANHTPGPCSPASTKT
jgi:hypothetical protein